MYSTSAARNIVEFRLVVAEILRRADHSSRGVLPTVLCRRVWSRNHKNPRERGGGQGPL